MRAQHKKKKRFGGPIRSMENGSQVSPFSPLPGSWNDVLHYKNRDDGKCTPGSEVGLVKRVVLWGVVRFT